MEQVLDQFLKYHIQILIEDCNEKLGREAIFKPTIGNGSLHKDRNDNSARIVKLATSTNLVVKITMFPHRNMHLILS
jgi:hypothetical protein